MNASASSPPRIVALGACVVDLTFWAPRRPEPGETLMGTRFAEFLGGKGFNQAVAAQRAGASAALIAAVGTDHYGDRFIAALTDEGLAIDGMVRVEEGTGVGQPLVTDDGEVAIVGIPRANGRLSAADVEAAAGLLDGAALLMLQCEVPVGPSRRAAELAHERGARVVLNTAPAGETATALLPLADILISNEVEAAMLLDRGDLADRDAALALHERVGGPVVITLGARGAIVADQGEATAVAAHPVEVVDPTGAGDSFCGAFAVAYAQGRGAVEACAFGNAAGALAVGVAGAEPSLPRRAAIEALLDRVRGASG